MRRPEADLLNKERTIVILSLLRGLRIKQSVIAEDFGVKPLAVWNWSKGNARGPKKLEEYLTKREAEATIA